MKRRMLYLRKTPVQSAFIIYILALGLILFPSDWLGKLFFRDEILSSLIGLGLMRTAMCAIMAGSAVHAGCGASFLPRSVTGVMLAVPALAIAVNNLPIIALANGSAFVLYGGGYICAFAFQCLAVGFFEEITFRGIVFPMLLQKTGTSVKGRLQAILFSAAMFGLLHIVNLLNGFSGGVFLQMGYSFLIGAMLAVAMFLGAGVLFCGTVHAIYNFCGLLIPTLGTGSFSAIWNTGEIVLTAVVAVLVIVYCILITVRADSRAGQALIAWEVSEGKEPEEVQKD